MRKFLCVVLALIISSIDLFSCAENADEFLDRNIDKYLYDYVMRFPKEGEDIAQTIAYIYALRWDYDYFMLFFGNPIAAIIKDFL